MVQVYAKCQRCNSEQDGTNRNFKEGGSGMIRFVYKQLAVMQKKVPSGKTSTKDYSRSSFLWLKPEVRRACKKKKPNQQGFSRETGFNQFLRQARQNLGTMQMRMGCKEREKSGMRFFPLHLRIRKQRDSWGRQGVQFETERSRAALADIVATRHIWMLIT